MGDDEDKCISAKPFASFDLAKKTKQSRSNQSSLAVIVARYTK